MKLRKSVKIFSLNTRDNKLLEKGQILEAGISPLLQSNMAQIVQ